MNIQKDFKCPSCNSKFTRKRNLMYHFEKKHSSKSIEIIFFLCGKIFDSKDKLENHNENTGALARAK